MDPYSTGHAIGFAIGVAVSLLIIFGSIGFGIFAIVKAFSTRKTIWIVLASIFGCFALFLLIGFLAAFINGVAKGIRENAARSGQISGPMQRYTGNSIPFSIQYPAGWTIKRDKEDFDIQGNRSNSYVAVIAEEQDMGGYDYFIDLIKKNLSKRATDISFSELENVEIDHHRWCVLTSRAKFLGMPFTHRFYFYTGKEGTYQIVCWTFQNIFDKNIKEMDEIVFSFKFPQS